MSFSDLKSIIIESPGWRTFFAFILPIMAGILSGAFVTEITQNSEILWKEFYNAKSFYGLLILSLCMYTYNKQSYLHEKQISLFQDADYCTAYMRSKCLPEAAERYKKLIRSGDGGELKQAMEEIKRVLK